MGSGRRWARRSTAAAALSVVAFAAAGPASAARIDLDTWSGRATGNVVELEVKLPAVLESAFETLDIDSPIPATIKDSVVNSLADAEWKWGTKSNTTGRGLGELLNSKGTIAGLVEKVGVKLPRADVSLGQPTASGNLAKVNAAGVSLGAGEVSAKALKVASKVLDSAGSSSIVDLQVKLGDLLGILPTEVQSQITAAIDQLLAVLYGGDELPAAIQDGVIPTLETQLGLVKETLAGAGYDLEEITGLDLSIPRLTRADLIDKPIVRLGLIQTTSSVTEGTGRLAGYKISNARSIVKDFSLLGDLIKVQLLESEAKVASNGKDTFYFDPVQKIVGLKIGNNVIDIVDITSLSGIRINGKPVDLAALVGKDLADTVAGLYQTLITEVVGLAVSVPKPHSEVQKTEFEQRVTQDVSALLVHVAPLSRPVLGTVDLSAAAALLPTIDAKISTSTAALASTPLEVLPRCIGACNAKTGVPSGLYLLVGPLLVGSAMVVRRFALSK